MTTTASRLQKCVLCDAGHYVPALNDVPLRRKGDCSRLEMHVLQNVQHVGCAQGEHA